MSFHNVGRKENSELSANPPVKRSGNLGSHELKEIKGSGRSDMDARKLYNPRRHSTEIKATKVTEQSWFSGLVAKVKALFASWFGSTPKAPPKEYEMESLELADPSHVDTTPPHATDVGEGKKMREDRRPDFSIGIANPEGFKAKAKEALVERGEAIGVKQFNSPEEAKARLEDLKGKSMGGTTVTPQEMQRIIKTLDPELAAEDFETNLREEANTINKQERSHVINFLKKLDQLEEQADDLKKFDLDIDKEPWFPTINDLGATRKAEIQEIRDAFKERIVTELMGSEKEYDGRFKAISDDLDSVLVRMEEGDKKGQPLLDRLAVARNKIDDKKQELKNLKGAIITAEREVERTKTSIDYQERIQKEKQASFDREMEKIFEQEKKVSRLVDDQTQLKATLKKQESELNPLKEELDALKEKLRLATDKNLEAIKTLTGLEGKTGLRAAGQRKLAERAKRQSAGDIKRLPSQIEEKKAQVEKYEQPLSLNVREVESYRPLIAERKVRMAKLNEEVEGAKARAAEFGDRLVEEKATLKLAEERYTENRASLETLVSLESDLLAVENSIRDAKPDMLKTSDLFMAHTTTKMVEGYPDTTQDDAEASARDKLKNDFGATI